MSAPVQYKITKLLEKWHEYIGKDHHKDRDCHFHVIATWSYGEPPKFEASHDGYLTDFCGEEHDTYQAAEDELLVLVKNMIQEERDQVLSIMDSDDDWGRDSAEHFIEIFGENLEKVK